MSTTFYSNSITLKEHIILNCFCSFESKIVQFKVVIQTFLLIKPFVHIAFMYSSNLIYLIYIPFVLKTQHSNIWYSQISTGSCAINPLPLENLWILEASFSPTSKWSSALPDIKYKFTLLFLWKTNWLFRDTFVYTYFYKFRIVKPDQNWLQCSKTNQLNVLQGRRRLLVHFIE